MVVLEILTCSCSFWSETHHDRLIVYWFFLIPTSSIHPSFLFSLYFPLPDIYAFSLNTLKSPLFIFHPTIHFPIPLLCYLAFPLHLSPTTDPTFHPQNTVFHRIPKSITPTPSKFLPSFQICSAESTIEDVKSEKWSQ